jgi:hypothetical protein
MVRTGQQSTTGNQSSRISRAETVTTKLIRSLNRLLILGLLMSAPIFAGCGSGAAAPAPTASNTDTTPTTTPAPVDGTITLTWDATTTRTDGSPLNDAVSYKLYYGTTPGTYSSAIDHIAETGCTIPNMAPGTYYFAITAYDIIGGESAYSNEVTRTIPQ